MTDITFEGDFVNVHGTWLRSFTLDFMLDAPSRRTSPDGFRRALVHDFGDCLTVNYGRDYPGGVVVNDTRTIRGFRGGDWVDVESRVVQIKGSDLMLDTAARRRNRTPFRRALVHGYNDELVINYNRDYPGGVTIMGKVTMPSETVIGDLELYEELVSSRRRLGAMEETVKHLEARLEKYAAGA